MLRPLSSAVTRTPTPATPDGPAGVVVDLAERRARRIGPALRITPELLAALAGRSK